jgi:8-oxo-dGTP pyrophosphatase MutT (NUDIX family)
VRAEASCLPTTIAGVSEEERASPRRRRGRRRRRSATPPNPGPPAGQDSDGSPETPIGEPSRPGQRLRTVRETSAGGLVIDGIERPRREQVAALIGRVDRRGRMLWSLPKGHIEQGETAEQTAVREVAEETGIRGDVLAALGSIDYWFVTEGRRVHKTVHHYLLRSCGGELCDEDLEVTEVAWVPVIELPDRLAYADERRLAMVAYDLIELLQTAGPDALPPLPQSAVWRRRQTHSRAGDRPATPPRTRGRSVNGGGPGT